MNPAEKTYSRLPLNAMMQMAGVVGKLVKIKIKNPVVNSEKLGMETIMGYPCQHSKQLMEYDMEVKIAIIKSKSHVRIEKKESGQPPRSRPWPKWARHSAFVISRPASRTWTS